MLVNIGKNKECWVENSSDRFSTCYTVKCFGANIKCKDCILSSKHLTDCVMVSVNIAELRKHNRIKNE